MVKRHKDDNTFRFASFTERIEALRLNKSRQLVPLASEIGDNETETHFNIGLSKWSDLNCSTHFFDFKNEVGSRGITLPMLLVNRDFILDALERHMLLPDTVALPALADLVTRVACDLQQHFYPRFAILLQSVYVPLVINAESSKNTETLEALFSSLTALFKVMARYVAKNSERVDSAADETCEMDIIKLFKDVRPLLAHPQQYIREFCAQSFAYLVRKLSKTTCASFIAFFLQELAESEANEFDETDSDVDVFAAGCGELLFALLAGLRRQLQPFWRSILTTLLDELVARVSRLGEAEQAVIAAFEEMLNRILDFISKDHSADFVGALLSFTQKAAGDEDEAEYSASLLSIALGFLLHLVAYRGAVLLGGPRGKVQLLEAFCKLLSRVPSDDWTNACLLLRCIVQLSISCSNEPDVSCMASAQAHLTSTARHFLKSLSKDRSEAEDQASLLHELGDPNLIEQTELFERSILPVLVELLYSLRSNSDRQGPVLDEIMRAVAVYVDEDATEREALAKLGAERRSVPAAIRSILEQFAASAGDQEDDLEDELPQLARVWAALTVLRGLACADEPRKKGAPLVDTLLGVRARLLNDLQTPASKKTTNRRTFVLGTVCKLLSVHSTDSGHVLREKDLFSLLESHANDTHVLRCVTEQLEQQEKHDSRMLTALFTKLRSSLASQRSVIRYWCLRLLHTARGASEEADADDDVLELALNIESTPLSVPTQRDWINALAKLERASLKSSAEGYVRELPMFYVLGVLRMNFTPLWQPCERLLATLLSRAGAGSFLKVFNDTLRNVATECGRLVSGDTASLSDISQVSEAASEAEEEDKQAVSTLKTVFDEARSTADTSENTDERPNCWRYRECLLKTVPLLDPSTVETRASFYVDQFFAFVRGELNAPVAARSPNITRSMLNSTLIAHLEVFIRVRVRDRVVAEPLRALVLYLLSSNDISVQSVAMRCQLAFTEADADRNGPSPLIAYRETLERLLDDKRMANELVVFSLSEESHRRFVLPVVVRMLFGRLRAKARRARNQKRSAASTDGLGREQLAIVRFLAKHCRTAELDLLLELVSGSIPASLAELNFGELPSTCSCDGVEQPHADATILRRKQAQLRFLLRLLATSWHAFSRAQLRSVVFSALECARLARGAMECAAAARLEADADDPRSQQPANHLRDSAKKLFLMSMNIILTFCTNAAKAGQNAYAVELDATLDLACASPVISPADVAEVLDAQAVKLIRELILVPHVSQLARDSMHKPSVLLRLLVTLVRNAGLFEALASVVLPLTSPAEERKANLLEHLVDCLVHLAASPVPSCRNARLYLVEALSDVFDACFAEAPETCSPAQAEAIACEARRMHKLLSPAIASLLTYLERLDQRAARTRLFEADLGLLTRLVRLLLPAAGQTSVPVPSADSVEQVARISDVLISALGKLPPSKVGLVLQPLKEVIVFLSAQSQARTAQSLQSLVRPLIALLGRVTGVHASVGSDAAVSDYDPASSCRAVRSGLCQLLTAVCNSLTVGRRDSLRSQLGTLASDMNAFDARFIEQPDFERRFDAFERAVKLLDSNSGAIDGGDDEWVDCALLTVNNCLWHLDAADRQAESTLKQSCGFALQQLFAVLRTRIQLLEATGDGGVQRSRAIYRMVIIDLIIAHTKRGLRRLGMTYAESAKDCAIRDVTFAELVGILRGLLDTFGSRLPFGDLLPLRDAAQPDFDFFDNIRHIQLARRTRALRTLIKLLKTSSGSADPVPPAAVSDDAEEMEVDKTDAEPPAGAVIRASTLRGLIWPMIMYFLNDSRFEKKAPTLVQSCLEAVTLVSLRSSWPHYSTTLRVLIDTLVKSASSQPQTQERNQGRMRRSSNANTSAGGATSKLLVKTVAAVIDGFHFDRSDERVASETTADAASPVHTALISSFVPSLLNALDKRAEAMAGLTDAQSQASDRDRRSRKRKAGDTESASRSRTQGTEGIELAALCVPFSKLISRLRPVETYTNWRSLVLRVGSWLKSRERDLRDAARTALCDSLLVLADACSARASRATRIDSDVQQNELSAGIGTSLSHYVRAALEELRAQLTTGFQQHVLCRVALVLVKRLVERRTAALELDSCTPVLTDLFNSELFGHLAEQKEVAAIVSRTPEAKAQRGFEAYELTLQHVSERSVLAALRKLDVVLTGASQLPIVSRLSRLLDRVAVALLRNARLSDDALLSIVADWLHSSHSGVEVTNGEAEAEVGEEVPEDESTGKGKPDSDAAPTKATSRRSRPMYVARDSRLVDSEPARYGHSRAKLTRDTRTTVRVEFGLCLLLGVLKKSKHSVVSSGVNQTDEDANVNSAAAGDSVERSTTESLLAALEERGVVRWLVGHVASAGDSDDSTKNIGRKEQIVRVKVLIMTLRCITQLIGSSHSVRLPLATVSLRFDALVAGTLVLLRKYVSSTTELHRELVTCIFKLLRLLARRKLTARCFDEQQLGVLVGYADQLLIKAQTNVYDHAQAQLCSCAFAILNLVAKRRTNRKGEANAAAATAINELFDRVKQLSLAHVDEQVRSQARASIVSFVNEAGFKQKQFASLLEFFAMQLLDDTDRSFAGRGASAARNGENEGEGEDEFEFEDDEEAEGNTQMESMQAAALEMLNALVSSAAARSPKVNEALTVAFVPLCTAVGNSRSAQLQRLSGAALRNLLSNLAPATREQLWAVAAQWLVSERAQLHRVALLVLVSFIQAEQQQFAMASTRLETVLERVAALMQTYDVSNGKSNDADDDDSTPPLANEISDIRKESESDRMQHSLLTVIELLVTECDVLKSRNQRVRAALKSLFESGLKRSLLHPHNWVRLVATRIFTHLLRSVTTEELVRIVCHVDSGESQTQRRQSAGLQRVLCADYVRELIQTFCKQMKAGLVNDAQCEQVIVNLSMLASVVVAKRAAELANGECVADKEEKQEDGGKKREDALDLASFSRRVAAIANFELVRYSQSTMRRSHVFRLIAAIFAHAERHSGTADGESNAADGLLTDQLVVTLISPLLRASAASSQVPIAERENEVEDATSKLGDLANEVLDVARRATGVERFTRLCASVETRLRTRRVARKRSIAQLAVTNPEAFARVKVRRNAKKRKRFASKIKLFK